MSGWVKLHRKAADHPALKRFDELGVWSMLLMRAAREPTTVRFRGKLVKLDRGQIAASVRGLAEKGGIGHGRMRNILSMFSAQGMLTVSTAPHSAFSLITICNYERFQDRQESTTQSRTQAQHSQNTGAAQTQHTEQEGENLESTPVEPVSLTAPAGPTPLPDPSAALWALCKALLPVANPGAVAGRWCGMYGEHNVYRAVTEFRAADAQRKRADPVSWIGDRLKRYAAESGTNDDALLADLNAIEEAGHVKH
jgi:hypothetical protein